MSLLRFLEDITVKPTYVERSSLTVEFCIRGSDWNIPTVCLNLYFWFFNTNLSGCSDEVLKPLCCKRVSLCIIILKYLLIVTVKNYIPVALYYFLLGYTFYRNLMKNGQRNRQESRCLFRQYLLITTDPVTIIPNLIQIYPGWLGNSVTISYLFAPVPNIPGLCCVMSFARPVLINLWIRVLYQGIKSDFIFVSW